jgi:hypothetical protein
VREGVERVFPTIMPTNFLWKTFAHPVNFSNFSDQAPKGPTLKNLTDGCSTMANR